jgi:hypothetical protein
MSRVSLRKSDELTLMAFSVLDKVNSFLWPINYGNDSVAVVVVWRQHEENASRPGIALFSGFFSFLRAVRCRLVSAHSL